MATTNIDSDKRLDLSEDQKTRAFKLTRSALRTDAGLVILRNEFGDEWAKFAQRGRIGMVAPLSDDPKVRAEQFEEVYKELAETPAPQKKYPRWQFWR